MQQQMQQPQIDLSKTTAINPENGKVWSQGVVLRKVSKFVTGTSEDALCLSQYFTMLRLEKFV